MALGTADALRAYARMMNTLDVKHIEPLLEEDFHYSSQWEGLQGSRRRLRTSLPWTPWGAGSLPRPTVCKTSGAGTVARMMPIEQFKNLSLEEMRAEIDRWPLPPPDPNESDPLMRKADQSFSSTERATTSLPLTPTTRTEKTKAG